MNLNNMNLLLILLIIYLIKNQYISYPKDYNKLERQWGTYYGGNDEETGKSKGFEIGHDGSIIIAGGTKSNNTNNKIASKNAFQTSLNGARDAFITKFNKDGTRVWGTYFGGNQWDFARDICLDNNENIYVTGFTGSTTVIGMDNSHQKVHSGGDDAFIAKFDKNGKRVWSTYFGGSENEHIHSIEFDGKGAIYTCGRTLSPNTNNIIATVGAYQSNLAGGADGYLAKFDTNGKRLWSTYIGAEMLDASKAIAFLPNGNLVLVVATESKQLKVSPNAYQKTHSGKNDSYLAIFSPNGDMLRSTYFGGTGEDHPQAVAISKDGKIILAGETESNGLAKGNVHQNVNRGDLDGFISIFDENLNLLTSTYFGGDLYDNILDVYCNDFNEIVVCGATESSKFISNTSSYQPVKNNGVDGYFAIFDMSLKLLYSSYYGAVSDDIIFGIRQKGDTIAFAGMTNSNSPDIFCSTNCFQNTFGGVSDIFIASFYVPISLNPPQILFPINNTKLSKGKITFRWSSVPNAINYNFIIYDNLQKEIVNINTSDTFIIYDNFYSGIIYHCKVKSMNEKVESQFSDTINFSIAKEKPQKIKMLYPINDTNNIPLQFDYIWENDSNSEWYSLTVLDDKNVTVFKEDNIAKKIGNTTSYPAKNLNYNTLYKWYVVGVNTDSTGDDYDVMSFSTLDPSGIIDINNYSEITISFESIKWSFNNSNFTSIEIIDYLGRSIYYSKEPNGIYLIKSLQTGVYFIRYKNESTYKILKFFQNITL